MDSLIQELEWGRRDNMFEDKDFELLEETPLAGEEVKADDINEADFALTEIDESVHEQKFQTKPTTFLKDSLKRFRKNKSSVVAAYILGALLLLAFIVPLVVHSDTSVTRENETFLAPKLFEAGTGFWDGTATYKNIAVDISEKPDAATEEEKQQYWWPAKDKFTSKRAISKKKFTEQQYINDISDSSVGNYAKEGYVHFGYYGNRKEGDQIDFASKIIPSLELNNDLYVNMFDVYDVNKINLREGKTDFEEPDNYDLGECALFFEYNEEQDDTIVEKEVQLTEFKLVHNIGSAVGTPEAPINAAEIIQNATGKTTFEDARFAVRMVVDGKDRNTCCLIGGIGFNYTNESEEKASYKTIFEEMSFTDATSCINMSIDNGYKYWSSTGVRRIYLSKAYFCSFVYDTYEAAFGLREEDIDITRLLQYQENGWISLTNDNGIESITYTDIPELGYCLDTVNFTCKILNPEKCPFDEPIKLEDIVYDEPDELGLTYGYFPIKCRYLNYKRLNYSSMPKYIMGTDRGGRDMFKYVFEGLRTSLLLGFITAAVCFLFGLTWGSISGYFGGTVDLVMERITDILNGIPFMVLMTLIIIHFGRGFGTLAIALCALGWIGTASRTRMQFYRFRGREYVLASRTLGASDARLIVKHILPNSLGTIITGAVLLIPNAIFSESTLAYLNLGLTGIPSLGVILATNEKFLKTEPYLLLFPAVIISLLLISFNLFGNGLRDAINPSLKGEE